MSKESYNKIYTENEITFGNGKPEKMVRDVLRFKTSGSVLELGAGEGRNALFLAENGFGVTAQDISDVGVEKIQKQAEEKGLHIETETSDARILDFDRDFDVIVSTFMMHHIRREEALALISHIQEHTNPKGLNALVVFTKNGDFYRKDPSTSYFYSDEGELRNLYNGWEILEYEEKEGPAFAKRPDGSPQLNVSARILARKG